MVKDGLGLGLGLGSYYLAKYATIVNLKRITI